MVVINKIIIFFCIIDSIKIMCLLLNYVLYGFEMIKYKFGNKLCFQYLFGLMEIRFKIFLFKIRIVGLFLINFILVNKQLVFYYVNL